jgi:hypothetical protein
VFDSINKQFTIFKIGNKVEGSIIWWVLVKHIDGYINGL